MSGVAIITTESSVVLVTDGGAYLPDGAMAVTAGKVVMLPEASTVITGRGSHLAHEIAARDTAMATERLTLDRIVELSPGHIAKVVGAIKEHEGDPDPRFSVYVAGWSEQRNRPEAWAVRSYATEHAPAATPYRLPECYLAPEVPQEVGDYFGLRMPATGGDQWRHDPAAYGTLALCAARFCPGRHAEELGRDDIDDRILIGAFLQVTTVTRHTVLSRIVHEWPDAVGQPINPEVGEPIPASLRKGSKPDDRPAPRPVAGDRPGKRARRRRG